MKIQTMMVEIVYDETCSEPPSDWDWTTLLDLADKESFRIIRQWEPEEPVWRHKK